MHRTFSSPLFHLSTLALKAKARLSLLPFPQNTYGENTTTGMVVVKWFLDLDVTAPFMLSNATLIDSGRIHTTAPPLSEEYLTAGYRSVYVVLSLDGGLTFSALMRPYLPTVSFVYYDTPFITSISPSFGSRNGSVVVVNANNFLTSGVYCRIGGDVVVAATVVGGATATKFLKAGRLQCTLPALDPGFYPIAISNNDVDYYGALSGAPVLFEVRDCGGLLAARSNSAPCAECSPGFEIRQLNATND